MSRRIEIELTSARQDGTWTWRAAGAREPKGILDGALLPTGSKIGSVLKADAEVELDGMTILAVTTGKEKAEKSGLLDLIPSDKPFEGVTQQLAKRERSDRPPRRDGAGGDRRPRRDNRRAPSVRPVTDPAANVRVEAPAPIVARAPSVAADRISPHRPSSRSDRSRSASSLAGCTAMLCSPTCPKSSGPLPSAPCKAVYRRCARPSTSRTSA